MWELLAKCVFIFSARLYPAVKVSFPHAGVVMTVSRSGREMRKWKAIKFQVILPPLPVHARLSISIHTQNIPQTKTHWTFPLSIITQMHFIRCDMDTWYIVILFPPMCSWLGSSEWKSTATKVGEQQSTVCSVSLPTGTWATFDLECSREARVESARR